MRTRRNDFERQCIRCEDLADSQDYTWYIGGGIVLTFRACGQHHADAFMQEHMSKSMTQLVNLLGVTANYTTMDRIV